VSITDEPELRQRLHEDLAALPVPSPPVGMVIRRGSTLRARRWGAGAAGLAAVAAVAAVAVSVSLPSGRPAAAGRPGPGVRSGPATGSGAATGSGPGAGSGPATGGRPAPGPVLTGAAFAAGTAAGRPWQLSVLDIADPGARCLPAIMLNGTDGDVLALRPGVNGGIASLAFLDHLRGAPADGYAALQVAPEVSRLTADLSNGRTVDVHPVTVAVCGRRVPLAGFSYPRSGVTTITAYAGRQVLTRVTPPATLFTSGDAAGGYVPPGTPGSGGTTLRLVPGVWQQLWSTTRAVAAGPVASGQLGGTRWRISVQLGAGGDCFLGRTFGGQVATGATDCMPVQAPPSTAVLQRFVLQPRAGMSGYAGLASPRAAYLMAALSDGSSLRVRPAEVGGRRYIALALPPGRAVTQVTVYGRSGRPLGTVSPVPAGS